MADTHGIVRTSQRERKNDNFGIYAGKIRELEQRAEALIAKQSSGVIEKIRKLMAEHGLTAADIEGHAGGKGRAKKVGAKTVNKGGTAAVKYCDPKSGATWTGHGRAPQWIASAKNRDKFLVDEVRRRRRLRAKRRLLAITSAVRSLRFIVTQRVARPGAGVGGRRRGLLVPKNVRSF